MDENILDDGVVSEESGAVYEESVVSDSEYSENVVESGADSPNSSSGSVSIEPVEGEDGTLIYYVESQEESLIDEELGGVPVVITDDVSVVADYVGTGGSSFQLSSYYVDYFSGVLANMPDSDYVAFAYRDYYTTSGYTSYTEHYILVYDIVVESGNAVAGAYPCIDIYRENSSSSYTVNYSEYALSSVPAFSYGSFGLYSDLRKGVSHDEMWTLLFAVGFAVVYSVCSNFFDFVLRLRRRTR